MLPLVDAIVIHPYRSKAHSVDKEIENLKDVMASYGTPVPIWATEFSHDIPDADEAAGEEIKMVTLLGASGVQRASWYALLDQPAFPTMGLYASTTLKPQGRAYRFAQDNLVPYGRATRLVFADPLFNAWQFGSNRIVVWGSPREITLGGTPQVYTSQGVVLPSSSKITIGYNPVIIVGGTIQSAGSSNVVADTLTGFLTNQWEYYSRDKSGRYSSVDWTNDSYTSYLSNMWVKPLRISMGGLSPAGNGTTPIKAVLRYTSPVAQSVELWSCFNKPLKGDGVDYTVTRNGVALASGVLTTRSEIQGLRFSLAAGDKFELWFGPNQTAGGDLISQRSTLFKAGTGSAVVCP